MKKIFKGLLLSFLLISSASLTSCFGFGEEALQINTITTVTLENGDIQVIITYTDEDVKPTTFVVPKGSAGEDGKDGNGIKEITSSKSEDGLNTLVNITFTQENVNPIQVTIPNGVSIKNIEKRFEEETQCTYIKFLFTDGTESEEYAIPKGEKGDKGEDGIGIDLIDPVVNPDDQSITLYIYLTSGEIKELYIPGPEKGEDGKEITSFESFYDKDDDVYIFLVEYNDGSTTEFEVARQNKWFTEDRKPDRNDGINGDIWYDVSDQVIYIKENNSWKEAINFEILQPKTYDIRFELNDSTDAPGKMPNTILDYEIYEDLKEGSCFASERITVPVPTREGYEFLGWYATKDKLNPTHGSFTDMTPIMSDLTLYARWAKIDSIEESLND